MQPPTKSRKEAPIPKKPAVGLTTHEFRCAAWEDSLADELKQLA